uniref:NB-ARC domain-containing protein n=1 Tax=Leersia perrieri TaxID=77586 RepID=A0A0D9V2A0_9ORYZ
MDCPRILRQPYSTYLFMERCMFGRHAEKDHILDFLMQPSSLSLDVLPIIGAQQIGKRTLVEHVLKEEIVQKHFSCIIRLNNDDLNNLENDSTIKRHNLISFSERCLIVVELQHDADLMAWGRFYSSFSSKINITSKVILSSCMQKVSTLGTTKPLKLKKMRSDEFWNFFRTLSFGSENPYEHQVLLSIAMEMARLAKGDFLCAHIVSRVLRTNFSAQFWSHILDLMIKGERLHFHLFGEHAYDRVRKKREMDRGVPTITVEDMLNKTAVIPSDGNFEVLRWQSPIAPYYSYMGNCVVKKTSQFAPKERCLKRKRKTGL